MKKSIRQLVLALFMTGAIAAHAQITWHFGNNAGLKFNSNGTTSPTTGPIIAHEGSAVLVDLNNNVVMYCNGENVWNGNGIAQTVVLRGDPSSTQTALIVPVPGSTTGSASKAFIFTVNAVENGHGKTHAALAGLRVSLVDIAGTAPNTTITVTPANSNFNLIDDGALMGEKLTVTKDGTGGYWVLTHGIGIFSGAPGTLSTINRIGEQKFYAYHVTCATTTIATLDATQVISTITNSSITPHQSYKHLSTGEPVYGDVGNQFNGQGQMKFNNAGTKIACTLPWFGRMGNSAVNPDAQLYNFNKTTGVVDNASAIQFNLGFEANTTQSKDGVAYGIEFSPNGSLLYVGSSFGSGDLGIGTTRVYQYNITSGVPATIKNSKTQVFSLSGVGVDNNNVLGGIGAMAMGPNGKIYIAKNGQNTIDVINNPNGVGAACNYGINSVAIGGTSYHGLPTTVLTYGGPSKPFIFPLPCKGAVTIYTGYLGTTPNSYAWVLFGSNSFGQAVNSNGTPVALQNSFYYQASYPGTVLTYLPGAGPSVLPSNLNTQGICGKYYTVMLCYKSSECDYLQCEYKTFQLKCNDPSFSAASNTSNNGYFTLAATPNDLVAPTNPGFGYMWTVEDLDASDNAIFTMYNTWQPGNTATNEFRDFDHTANNYTGYYFSLPYNANLAKGKFLYNHRYRITRSTWDSDCLTKSFSLIQTYTPHLNADGNPEVVFVEDKNPPDFSYLKDLVINKQQDNKPKNELFTVSPNPSNGIFNIELHHADATTLEVFDMIGNTIKTVQITNGNLYKLDLTGYAKGIYLIKMQGSQQAVKKIIVQ